MVYETLQEAVGRRTQFEVIEVKDIQVTIKGEKKDRKKITIKKKRSSKLWVSYQYENGNFSGLC